VRRALLLVLLAGCAKTSDPPVATKEFVDSRGKTIRIAYPPRRIVSIIPSTTELLYAVGAGDQIAGVTTWCDWPPEAKSKPKIGDIQVDYEKLTMLKPDVVVTYWSQTKKTSTDIESKGIPLFSVEPHSFEEIIRSLRMLGRMTGHDAEGEQAASALEARGEGGGRGAGADGLLRAQPRAARHDGARDVCGRRAAPRGGAEHLRRRLAPDRLGSGDEARPRGDLITHDRKEGLERRAGWANLRAVKNKRVYFVAKENYLYPTPRLVNGLEEAARIFREKNP
jgi:iron complex transport system substrate-binding protein